jgi:membrane-anchored protein YejM (alkaline phosphatase superfamily)
MSKTFLHLWKVATFCLANMIFWIVLSVKYFQVCGIEYNFWGLVFSVTTLFAHYGFIGLLLFLILIPFRMAGAKIYALMAVLLGTFLMCLLAADIFVFTQYRMHLNPALVGMFLSPVGKELVPIPAAMWAVAAGLLLFFAALTAGTVRGIETHMRRWRRTQTLLLAFGAFSLLTYDLIYIGASYTNYAPVLTRAEALPYLQTMSANSLLRRLGVKEADRNIAPSPSGSLQYPAHELQFAPGGAKPNILLILLDSWRPDSLNAETMPLLYKRSLTANRFNNHFSGGNATRAGVFSAFYGIPASYWHSFLAVNRRPVLMDELAKSGYDFAIYATANLTKPEFDRTVFYGIKDLRLSSKGNSATGRDLDSQQGFIRFLDRRDTTKPFFGFLFYDALHSFAVPEGGPAPFSTELKTVNYFTLDNNTDPGPIRNLYKNSAYNLDRMLGNLFAELEQRNLPDNTIIIISGDHAQEINDTHTNCWGHNSNFSEYQVKVPMLIFWPGKTAASHDYLTTHFDIVPTLMREVLSCTNTIADYSSGKNLFDPALREFGIIASYNRTAILAGGEVFVLDKYGMNQGWNLAYTKKTAAPPPLILKSAFDEISRFYRRQ